MSTEPDWRPQGSVETDGITVAVETAFLPDESVPNSPRYVYAYRITVHNHDDRAWRLVYRHWRITDGMGHVEHVDGPGVVGEQPRMEPGEGCQYVSFCPLPTEVGAMVGHYDLVGDDGATRIAAVPEFALVRAEAVN